MALIQLQRPILICAFATALILIIQISPLLAQASQISVITPSPPAFVNLSGDKIDTTEAGRQIIIKTTFTSKVDEKTPFVGFIEVRDSNDVTDFLAYQSGVIEPKGNRTLGFSWSAQEASGYQVRSFALSGLEQPSILTDIVQNAIIAR